MPSSSARYSATLLVASPIVSLRSASTSPEGSVATAAIAAGPGFPREPPSTLTTTFGPAQATYARTSSSARASEITFWARCEGISSWRANSIV